MSEENKAMVRRMVEAINAGEEDASVDELFAPGAARRVKRRFAQFRSAFPDWQEEAVELVAEGDTVAGRFKCSGTHLGKFLGEVPTGNHIVVDEVFFLRAEGGKFVDFWALEDSMERMDQLELIPSPPSPGLKRWTLSGLRRTEFTGSLKLPRTPLLGT